MSETRIYRPRHREGLVSVISAGFFFILVGVIFVTTPNLFNNIVDFFKDFKTVQVPNTAVFLPAPARPSTHLNVYSAVGMFCLIWGIFQICALVLRFFAYSPYGKKAENASKIVYWLGAYYLVITFLNATLDTTRWFMFWSAIIMWLGFSLIVRAIILAAKR